MKILKSAHVLIFSFILIMSCAAPEKKDIIIEKKPVKKQEAARKHYGKAVITEIKESNTAPGEKNTGFSNIYFRFIPSDTGAPANYLCKECPDSGIKLFYDNRDSFHANWIKKWDIKPGNEYPAIRHELTREDQTSSVTHEVFLEPE